MAAVSTPDRAVPPMDADERTTLASWLDFYRATLARKCDGLSGEQLRRASAEPSPITLLGLVQHMAEVERNWFRRVLAGEDTPPIFPADAHPEGHDGGLDVAEDTDLETASAIWHAEIDHARANCAARALDSTSPLHGGRVTLRWIYPHMIAEYARHCGHADLVRERIDGRTGV